MGGGGNGLIGGVFRNGSCIVSCVGFNNSADYQEQFSTRLRTKYFSLGLGFSSLDFCSQIFCK